MSEYSLPKDLAEQHSISLKTVYNYLSKYSNKIRTQKQYGKTFVHIDDFTMFFQGATNSVQSGFTKILQEQSKSSKEEQFEADSKLQEVYKNIVMKNENQKSRITVLEKQVSDYALLYKEEKNEKKELLIRYDKLQDNLNETVKGFSKEQIKWVRKYYSLLAICLILCLALGLFAFKLI